MLSALDLARRIEAGKLTPRAVVDMCAEAIAAREKEVGAFVVLDLVAARQRGGKSKTAVDAAARAARSGSRTFSTPPISRPQYGSPIYAGFQPRADAAAVALTLRAGGIVIGKTVTTEFATMVPAVTRNPHNLAHTPGGSSSGSVRGNRRRHAADRVRQPDRGLGDPAGGVLRHRRLQAVVSADPDGRRQRRRLASRHRRRVRRRRSRRRFRHRGDHRPRSARGSRDAGAAAHRAGAQPSVAASKPGDATGARKRGAERGSGRRQSRGCSRCRRSWKKPTPRKSSFRNTKRCSPAPSNTIAIATSSASRCARRSTPRPPSPPTPTTRRAAPPSAPAKCWPTPWPSTT